MKKTQTPRKTLAPGIARVLKRLHYPLDVMLLCVRWYVAYSLSLRNLEEMMAERGIAVDHSTVNRWVSHVISVPKTSVRRRLDVKNYYAWHTPLESNLPMLRSEYELSAWFKNRVFCVKQTSRIVLRFQAGLIWNAN